jgi:hypothetical protein
VVGMFYLALFSLPTSSFFPRRTHTALLHTLLLGLFWLETTSCYILFALHFLLLLCSFCALLSFHLFAVMFLCVFFCALLLCLPV